MRIHHELTKHTSNYSTIHYKKNNKTNQIEFSVTRIHHELTSFTPATKHT